MKVEPEFVGKTYNDFLIRPRMGVVDSRREVALTSPLTTRLTIELPVVSANMDSVTGASMAKARRSRVASASSTGPCRSKPRPARWHG